ncbi:alpha/beta hydrolase [Tardisphaera miroshnichenkoae]
MDNFAIVDGDRIHYIEEGNGDKPLLLFHGSSFNARTWVDVGTVSAAVSIGFRVISVDFPGYGQSQGQRKDLSKFIGDFIEVLNWVKQPVLLGASMGARAVLEYALSIGGRDIKALVLVGPVGLTENADRLSLLSGVKVLGIWGSEDNISPASNARFLKNIGATVEIIDKAPHACYMKEPQKFNEIVVKFLNAL